MFKDGERYGTLPSQFHAPADGLGHLFMFPVEELEKHSDRLIKILEDKGVTSEVLHEEGDWKRFLLNGDIDPCILDELYDVHRAIKISHILGEGPFVSSRNAALSMDTMLQVGATKFLPLGNFFELIEKGYSADTSKVIKSALEFVRIFSQDEGLEIDDNLVSSAIDEIEVFEKLGQEGDTPEEFKSAFLDFLSVLNTRFDELGQLEGQKALLRKVIDSINKNLLAGRGQFSLESFANTLRDTMPKEVVDEYADFVRPDAYNDLYSEISQIDLFKKGLERAQEITEGGIDRVVLVTGNETVVNL